MDNVRMNLKKIYNIVLFSYLGALIILAFITVVLAVSWYLTTVTSINEITLGIMNTTTAIMLAVISLGYAYFTHQIVSESKKENKIKLIEKQLEMFYHPLQDILNSEEMFHLCYHDEIDKAEKIEQHAIDIQNNKGPKYSRPKGSILNELYKKNNHAKIADLKNLIPYKYLATRELSGKFEVMIQKLYDTNPQITASNNPEFKNEIGQMKKTIDNYIESLIEDHHKLVFGR